MQASAVETAQRDDGTLAVANLISAYEEGVDELRLAVAGMTVEQLRSRPVAGKWSTLEVVCHIADCEQFFADRMKRTVAMDRPLLLGADGFRYPEPLCYQEHDLEQELDLVAVTRRQMARTLRLVATDAWQRTAVHSESGLVTLRQLLLHAINHLRHHLRFVAEKRAAMTTPLSLVFAAIVPVAVAIWTEYNQPKSPVPEFRPRGGFHQPASSIRVEEGQVHRPTGEDGQGGGDRRPEVTQVMLTAYR
jgi:uncharacterized damage-inducible protein DinB